MARLRLLWSRHLTPATILLVLCFYAGGQIDAQALPTASGPGSNITLGGGLSWFQQDYGHRRIGGAFGFLDIQPHWRYGVEGEARMLRLNTAQQVVESTYLAGPRIIVSREPSSVQPYVKFLVGAGRITLPYDYAHGTFISYAPGAGVDVSLGNSVKLRLIDVEYQKWSDFPYGTLRPWGISTGISVRLTPLCRFPRSR